jgi:hypothetical protein
MFTLFSLAQVAVVPLVVLAQQAAAVAELQWVGLEFQQQILV